MSQRTKMSQNRRGGSGVSPALLFCVVLLAAAVSLGSCNSSGEKERERFSVITTNFPPCDFARVITRGAPEVRLTMLLKPGAESHSWEPSPQDIIAIQNADVFIYVGGESDSWVNQVLESMDTSRLRIVTLMDCVDLVEEEIVEGMEEEDKLEDLSAPEYDEHVWTSPRNAKLIVKKIAAVLCEADPAHAKTYEENAAAYAGELDALDREFRDIVRGASRKTLIFADRFPFRYFTDAYGLTYYAAFPGCSTETEPSAATVRFLIDKVKTEKIPLVFHIEFSNGRMADAVSEDCGVKKALFHSVHNVSRDELASGESYLTLMRRNQGALREALY